MIRSPNQTQNSKQNITLAVFFWHFHVCRMRACGITLFLQSQAFPQITPTQVGRIHIRPEILSVYPNHSHVCEISDARGSRTIIKTESFPHLWDGLSFLFICALCHRIIPTPVE